MSTYETAFCDYINKGSSNSAATMIPLIQSYFKIKSVVDFGCGQGAWLWESKRLGAREVLGLDGDYVNKEALLIERSEPLTSNLSNSVDLGRKFDLVESLEVAEHFPETAADAFVDTLVRHRDVVFFSAVPVGQGGHDHNNEQPYEYGRDNFLKRNFILIDWIRAAVKDNSAVEPWYRHNSFCFVRINMVDSLPSNLLRLRGRQHGSCRRYLVGPIQASKNNYQHIAAMSILYNCTGQEIHVAAHAHQVGPQMNRSSVFLLLGASIAATIGQILFRVGARDRIDLMGFINHHIIFGLVFYALAMVAWIYPLAKEQMVTVYAFTALTFVLVYLGGAVLLWGQINTPTSIGISLVID